MLMQSVCFQTMYHETSFQECIYPMTVGTLTIPAQKPYCFGMGPSTMEKHICLSEMNKKGAWLNFSSQLAPLDLNDQ